MVCSSLLLMQYKCLLCLISIKNDYRENTEINYRSLCIKAQSTILCPYRRVSDILLFFYNIIYT